MRSVSDPPSELAWASAEEREIEKNAERFGGNARGGGSDAGCSGRIACRPTRGDLATTHRVFDDGRGRSQDEPYGRRRARTLTSGKGCAEEVAGKFISVV